MKKFREKLSQNYLLHLRPSQAIDKNSFNAYETSWETEYFLESECNRIIYGEVIDWRESKCIEEQHVDTITKESGKNDNKTITNDINKDEDEQQENANSGESAKWWTKFEASSNRPNTLREISLNVIVKNFTKGVVDDRISCQDAIDFGLEANLELPLTNLLDFDVNFSMELHFMHM